MTRRSGASERGVAAIELAVVLMLLSVIVFGITEIGRAMYQYEALTKSARAAARYLAVKDSKTVAAQVAAKCLAVYGVVDCGRDGLNPVVPGLTTANVTLLEPDATAALRDVETGAGALDMVSVTISPPGAPYRFVSIVPWVFPSLAFGPISAAMPQSFF